AVVSAAMASRRTTGSLALVGGGEWGPAGRDLDADLVARSGAAEVLVLPTASAYEHPERVGERATAYFADLGVTARTLPLLHRAEAEDPEVGDAVRARK